MVAHRQAVTATASTATSTATICDSNGGRRPVIFGIVVFVIFVVFTVVVSDR